MIKVRFHLAQGENYMKWQVKNHHGEVTYHDPQEVTLAMYECKLVNQQGTAQKIFDGANKTVCAWIECEGICILASTTEIKSNKVSYNPRVAPHWMMNGVDVDGIRFNYLKTSGRSVYFCPLHPRKCDITGEGMSEGYCIGDGFAYIKYKEDFEIHIKEETGYESVDEAYEDDYYYYTEWDELDDYVNYTADGKEVFVED